MTSVETWTNGLNLVITLMQEATESIIASNMIMACVLEWIAGRTPETKFIPFSHLVSHLLNAGHLYNI